MDPGGPDSGILKGKSFLMYSVTTFFLLFMIATAVAIVIRRFHIPYTVALVLAGLLLGFLHAIEAPHLR